MFVDHSSQTIIDSKGWVDHGALNLFDLNTDTQRLIPLSDASYLQVAEGANGFFRVVHQGGERSRISVHHVKEPELAVASATHDRSSWTFEGDPTAWAHVESAAIVTLGTQQRLVSIAASGEAIKFLELSWFNDQSYDLGHQGLTGCLQRPDGHGFVVSVQRSSTLVLLDQDGQDSGGRIELSGGLGSPDLLFLTDDLLVTTDYDTLLPVAISERLVKGSRKLQVASPGWGAQNIGAIAPLIAIDHVLVARPFSGDVLKVRVDDLVIVAHGTAPFQPLAVCQLDPHRFACRDWHTGRWHIGFFNPTSA